MSGSICNSFKISSLRLWPAVLLMNFISDACNRFSSDFFIVQASLPYDNTRLAKVL
jgi:hypothetical protein